MRYFGVCRLPGENRLVNWINIINSNENLSFFRHDELIL